MTNQPKLEKLDAIKNPYNLNNVARRNTQTIYFVNGKHIHVGDADTVYWAWLEGAEAQLSADEKVLTLALKQEREKYQQFMQGFPITLNPISEYCLCEKWKCTFYQSYPDGQRQDSEHGVIGWCKRFETDPDAGYVHASLLPPCVTWAVKRD